MIIRTAYITTREIQIEKMCKAEVDLRFSDHFN